MKEVIVNHFNWMWVGPYVNGVEWHLSKMAVLVEGQWGAPRVARVASILQKIDTGQ